MPRCSNKKFYAPDTDGVWHVIVPDSGMRAYLRTADGQVVRVKGAAEVRRRAGGKDGEAVVIAAAEPPDPAMFDLVEPVSVQQVYGTNEVKQAAWTATEHELYQRLVEADQDERKRLKDTVRARFDGEAVGPRFGIGVVPDDADGYRAGFLPADGSGSLTDAAVHAPLPDPEASWRLGGQGVDRLAAAAVLALRQAGVPVAKSEQIMRRVRLIADTAEAGMLPRPDSSELDALLMALDERYRPEDYDEGTEAAEVDMLMSWLLGRDGDIDQLDAHTRLFEAAGSWMDDTSASLLDNTLNELLPLPAGRWRIWRTLLESAAAADPAEVDQMFGEDVEGWRKAVRWAAGLPVAWDVAHNDMSVACMFAVMEGRPEGVPQIGADMLSYGKWAMDTVPSVSVDGFGWQRGRHRERLAGVVSPEGYAEIARSPVYRYASESLAHEQDQVVEATLAMLPSNRAIRVAPSGFISRVATSAAARIADDPVAGGSNAALKSAFFRWNEATSDDATTNEGSSDRLDPDEIRALADLVVGGLAAQAGGQGSGVLDFDDGRSVVRQVPFMLGDRDDATATKAAKAVLHHSNYASMSSLERLHLLATPAGRRALDGLTADAQDGLYDRIAKDLRWETHDEAPAWWGRLADRVQVAVGGRITLADVFANIDTRRCVRAAAAAAVAAGLDGDPADPDTHPEWADLLGDTPGGHKVALIATNHAEQGYADETPVRGILDLAGLFLLRPDRPV